MIIWILIGASVFSNFHMFMGGGKLVSSGIADFNLSPGTVILLMQLTMIFMGFIIDDLIIVIICAPLFTPIAIQLGYDPVWFGILMILNIEIAIMTPPYGFALFYMKAVVPEDVTMMDIYKSIVPFLAIKVIVLALCMKFHNIVTWLPNLLFD
jgi:TRAP-type mannitol/chloroaromatic compound transport system permease large subunit